MNQVTSPTCRPTKIARTLRWVRLPLAAALCIGLVSGLTVAGTARGEDLRDRRDDVRRAIVQSKREVGESREVVGGAMKKLAAAQAALAKAERKLAAAGAAVARARAVDAAIGARLAAAQKKLAAAKAAVAAAKLEVTEQLKLIGEAARSAYQQQSDLVGLTVVFDSASTGDLSQRLQWSTTIFDTTSAEMARLKVAQAKLQKARDAQAEIERDIAADKAAAAANLRKLRGLENAAQAAKASVADLVARRAAARKAAQADLDKEQAQYRSLQAQENRISAEIRRRAEIARKKQLAEEARRRAAARKANKKYVPKTESSRGFIYPVNARAGSPFGLRFHPILRIWRMHRGTDFGAPCGRPLYAVANGRVASARWSGGFGKYTVIDHGFVRGKFVSTGYAHQSRMIVHAGQRVRQGQVIGYVGTTGLSTGCHLHFQVYVNGGVVNPMNWL